MLRLKVRQYAATTWGCSSIRSSFCTATETASKRKAFRAIPLDMKLMDKLDTMNLGTLPNRKMRVAVSAKLGLNESRVKTKKGGFEEEKRPTPFPFYCKGRVVHTAHDGSTIPDSFPGEPPEIALIGRSNVGKSTLMNALLKFDQSYVQKAIVSEKPGETKYLTFFELGQSFKPTKGPQSPVDAGTQMIKGPDGKLHPYIDKTTALMLVDMPGYGFAFMSAEDKVRAHFLCLDYLVSNMKRGKVLKRVVLLVDGRHGLKGTDALFLQDLQRHLLDTVAKGDYGEDSLEARRIIATLPRDSSARTSLDPETEPSDDLDVTAGTGLRLTGKNIKLLSRHLGWKLQIVLTKCDLVERTELCRRIASISDVVQERVPALYHSMLPTLALSAKQLRGIEEIQRELAALVPPIWEGAPNYYKPPVDSEGNVIVKNPEGIRRTAGAERGRKATDKDEEPRLSYAERRKQREAELAAAAAKEEAGEEDEVKPKSRSTKEGKEGSTERTANATSTTTSSQTSKDSNGQDRKHRSPARDTVGAKEKKAPAVTKLVDYDSADDDFSEEDYSGDDDYNWDEDEDEDDDEDDMDEEEYTRAVRGANRAAPRDTTSSAGRDTRGVAAVEEEGAARKGGRVRRPAPVRKTARSDRDRILQEYGHEIDGYFGEEGLEPADVDESDDDVNWKAAGEDYGERSDEEDMLLEEAVLADEVGGYRHDPFNRPRDRSMARARQHQNSSSNRGGYGIAEEEGPSRRQGKKRQSGGQGKGQGQRSSGAEKGGQGKSGRGQGKGKEKEPKSPPKFSKFKAAAGPAWPHRVPKTPDNPKGRHRMHKVGKDGPSSGHKGSQGKKGGGGGSSSGKGPNADYKKGLGYKARPSAKKR